MHDESGGARVVRFGPFELDKQCGELRRQGVRIKLQEQPLRILEMLLASPDRLVTREEVRRELWPSNSFVDFDQGLNKAINKLREALGDSAEEPRFVETLSRRGYRFIGTIEVCLRRIESLAVLPLENLSRDPDEEYFAEGMTEALITTLAKIGQLQVVSRTSVMRYRGIHKPLPEIARELGVDAIVEGTVLRAKQRVCVSTQLIDGRDDRHLWAERYERDLHDVLALQSEVAQAIAREIQVKLTPQEHAHLLQVRPVNPEGYEAYLKGRYYWYRRPAELGKAIQCFEQVIAKDPTYATAYAGLADCLTSLTAWGLVPASDGSDKAMRLATKAVELSPGLAEGHSALAYSSLYDYNYSRAEKEFERAIEINPRDASAHELFGFYLGATGRYEEAYTELQRALRLDPLSSIIGALAGYVYLYGRRYGQAITQFQKTLDLDPTCGPAYAGLGWAQTCASLYEAAIVSLRKGYDLWRGSTPLAWLGETLAKAGRPEEAHQILGQLDQIAKQRYVTPYGVARIYAALGRTEEAFSWLETSYRQRAEWMILLKVDPCFDDLRSDPRFQDLLRRMNFPP